MKNKILILLITLISSFQLSYGQNTNSVKINTEKLIGIWYLKLNGRSESLRFVKNTTSKINHGTRIEFFENGDITDSYTAPCGNDRRIHHFKGKWLLNTEDLILTTTIPINNNGTIYKVLELTSNQLIIKEIEPKTP